jgi:hypothetical protein
LLLLLLVLLLLLLLTFLGKSHFLYFSHWNHIRDCIFLQSVVLQQQQQQQQHLNEKIGGCKPF